MIRFSVTYDITSNSKRTRLVKILEEFGERVQYSIFEFKLTEAQYINMMKRLKVKHFLESDKKFPKDSINIYYFDRVTTSKIERYGNKIPTIERDFLTFI